MRRVDWQRFVPRVDRPITWGSALPAIIFIVLYAALAIGLELSGKVLFARPGAFIFAVVMPWIWWVHHNGLHGLSRGRALTALLTRLALSGVLVMLLAEPRAVRSSDRMAVVYAVDVSDSIGESTTDQALSFVARTVQEKPEDDHAGLVVFGGDAAVELPPRETFPFEVINARVRRDGTSLERGLSLAGAMVPDAFAGRVVLISDGVETDGGVSAVLDAFSARKIPVDVLPVDYEFSHEVWLEKLELPPVVKLGETYEAAIVLSSLNGGRGRLVLRENDEVVQEQEVDYGPGKTRFQMPLYYRSPGYYEYTARIEPLDGRDAWELNNVAVSHLFIRGEGKALIVTDPLGSPADWTTLKKAMQGSGLVVDTRDAFSMPRDPMPLMPYDSVLYVNVPADAVDAAQMAAVHDAVYGQGIGFMMVGGKNGFGAGGYNRTAIERALPVSMDIKKKKVMPKGALAIILHTCEFAQGNTWGKRIAKEAIRVLGEQDEVGVLVYSWGGDKSGEQWLFPLTPASEYDELVPLINAAQIGDMPSFSTTMTLGIEGLEASDAATKHMIIISDGDPSPPPPKLLDRFVKAGVSISTVSINPHGGTDVAIMNAIAKQTGGQYYAPQDPSLLPSIFIKEAKTLKRSMIQNLTFAPAVDFPSPIMKGIESIPDLHGYVVTLPKPRAKTILVRDSDTEDDPVLATWRYGLGTTAAFTSDLAPNWGKDWVSWERYQAFVKQLVQAISRVQRRQFIHLSAFAEGNTGIVSIEDYHPDGGFLDVKAEVTGPNKTPRKLQFKQSGPRSYEARFPLAGVGRYQILAAASAGERSEQVMGGFTVPYSPEYLRFRSNPILLRDIAARTGGRVLAGDETGAELFGADRQPRRSSVPIIDWFLIALACLIPLDVGVRRVQIDVHALAESMFGRRRGGPTETMGALLKRKQAGESQSGAPRAPRPRPRPAARATRSSGASTPVVPEQVAPTVKDDPDAEASTTGRLLARKRKWQDDDEA